LKEVVPRVARVTVMWNPATSNDLELQATRAAARPAGNHAHVRADEVIE